MAGDERMSRRERARFMTLTLAVVCITAVVLAVVAGFVVSDTVARATESYSPVEATVVDERIEQALVAARQGSQRVDRRFVVVELGDGTTADVRSDDVELGSVVTLLRSDRGAVVETQPPRPTPFEWVLSIGAVVAALGMSAVAYSTARTWQRSRGSE